MSEHLIRDVSGGKPYWGPDGGGGGVTLIMPAEYTVTPVGTIITVDWLNRVLNDSVGNPSIDFETRFLAIASGVATVNWTGCFLSDENGQASLDWSVKELYKSDGTVVFDWTNGSPTNIPNAAPGTEVATINAILAKLATYGMN